MASALPVVLWLDSPLGLVVSSFSGAVFGSGLPGCVSLFPALLSCWHSLFIVMCEEQCFNETMEINQSMMKPSNFKKHQTANRRFSTCWKQKICHHFVLVVIVRDSQAAIPSFRMGHMFRLVCTDHLWGRGYKTWPSEQCSSVWTLLTSSVLRLCSTNSSILSGIMNHSECCRLVHHPAVDRSSLTATPSSFTFGLHDFWWNRWCIFNKIQSYLSDQSGLTCFSCPNWIKCVCVCVFLDEVMMLVAVADRLL